MFSDIVQKLHNLRVWSPQVHSTSSVFSSASPRCRSGATSSRRGSTSTTPTAPAARSPASLSPSSRPRSVLITQPSRVSTKSRDGRSYVYIHIKFFSDEFVQPTLEILITKKCYNNLKFDESCLQETYNVRELLTMKFTLQLTFSYL